MGNGDVPRPHVDQNLGDDEGRHPARPPSVEQGDGLADALETADAGADVDRGVIRDVLGDGEIGIVESFLCGHQGVVDEAVVLLRLFGVDIVRGNEPLDLRAEVDGEALTVETSDRPHSLRPARRGLPEAGDIQAKGDRAPSPVTTTRFFMSGASGSLGTKPREDG